MIARALLVKWAIAASSVASAGLRVLPENVVGEMVDAAIANPLTSTDDGLRTTLSLEVSIAWFEGQNRLDALGDLGRSFCWAQIYLPDGAHTREGWSGEELRHDAAKCATVAVRLIKASVVASPTGCELCVYARGPAGLVGGARHAEAQHLSDHRVALAKRLLREVPLEVTP